MCSQADMDLAIGRAVHDLTTSITHKAATPGRLDEDCAVLGKAIVGRLADADRDVSELTCEVCGGRVSFARVWPRAGGPGTPDVFLDGRPVRVAHLGCYRLLRAEADRCV